MDVNDSFKTVYDLCIIGAGPAGIITALEYNRLNPHKNVLLLEYGRKEQKTQNYLDDSIVIQNPVNHHLPYDCTNKGLGGTTATWGGRCVTYDKVDFMDRPIIGDANTWDVNLYEDVNQYLECSAKYFDCGRPQFNLSYFKKSPAPIAENFIQGYVTDTSVERWSLPTRFGRRYAARISRTENIILLSGWEAYEFQEPDDEGAVKCLVVRDTLSKEQYRVQAKKFVIAAGAQETTRMLLRNKRLFKLLNAVPHALGKYYQGHVSGKIASIKFYGNPKKTDYRFLKDKNGIYVRRRFQFTHEYLIKENLLNTAFWLDNPRFYDPKHKSGAMSFIYLAMLTPIIGKKLAPAAIAYSITSGQTNKIGMHLRNVIKGFPSSLTIPASIFYRRYCIRRKLPGLFTYSPENTYALHFHAEQIPVENNQMKLAADGETLVINYSLTDEDIASVIKSHEALDDWLRKCNCGELEYWFQKTDLVKEIRNMSKDGLHQAGTTRIADSPERGVVNRDLRLWGTKNVFVCSSSVFPTSGQANPTFFLGAFAARLADHLTHN